MMTDRELWVSVFNTALTSAMATLGPIIANGKPTSAYAWAKDIADQTLKDAPEDHP